MNNLEEQFQTQTFASHSSNTLVNFLKHHILLQQHAVATRITTWQPVICFHTNGYGIRVLTLNKKIKQED
jgi:hypothetical protein